MQNIIYAGKSLRCLIQLKEQKQRTSKNTGLFQRKYHELMIWGF